MKYLIIFLSFILFASCNLSPYQDVKIGWIAPELSYDSLTAITDGTSVYLTRPDSLINDSCKFKIFFIKQKFPKLLKYSENLPENSVEKLPWKKGLFTCYKSERVNLGRSYYFNNYVTDTNNSIIFHYSDLSLQKGEKVYIFWKGDVTKPTYKVIN